MNNIYLYDGHFSSLLSLIVQLLNIEVFDIKSKEEYVPSLFDNVINLKIENNIEYLRKKISSNVIRCCHLVYLSNNKDKEIIIYNFIKQAIKYNNSVFNRRYLPYVNEAIVIAHRVTGEAHKLKGFLRFKKMKNNFYYAKYKSDNNVLGILSNHFKKRLSEEYWIIKDEKRNIYAIYDKEKVVLLNQNDILKLNLDFSVDENYIEELWKTFFKTIAIKERKNLRCQMNFMPKKYWNNLIEMEK